MEIVKENGRTGDGLVQIAFAETREEAALMRGLLREEGIRSLAKQGSIDGPALGAGLLTRSTRRIYVRAEDAEAARTLLSETMVEDPLEAEFPEPANASYLAQATSNNPRDYNLLGAYARACLAAIVLVGLALVVFLLVVH
ncbi:MAG: DUF2007 domain-containing protein [Actinobacteria bacterium]|nr:DUF2007 domain-containing protein [Actinomycetota bacterium]